MTEQRKGIPLPIRILIGLVAGVILGVVARQAWPARIGWTIDNIANPVGQIFLRMVFMAVVPLVFCALALGVAGLKDLVKLGRIGVKSLGFTLVISTCAVLIGVGLVNLVQPGKGLPPEAREKLKAQSGGDEKVQQARQAKSLAEALVEIVPKNPLEDAVNAFTGKGGGLLAVMFFAFVFGLALATVKPASSEPVIKVLEGVFDVLMKIIHFAMLLAPIGVAALIYITVSRLGIEVMGLLAKYIAVVVAGLAIHMFVVYSVLLKFVMKMSPIVFFRQIREVILMAFTTSSSNATLPTSLRVTEENLGVPKDITHFVLTLGSTANQNGTALFEGVTVLFLAQFYGIDLSLGQQITVVVMSVLAGVGTAGVPGGSLPAVVLVMQTVGIPGEGIGIILGVDRFLDMCRTTLNVTGDITVAAYVARSEGHVLREA